MAGPNTWAFRPPAVAGTFYPDDAAQCRAQAQHYLGELTAGQTDPDTAKSPAAPIGAVVPHAGWICSAAIAGEVIRHLAQARPSAQVIVVFGAIHTPLPIERAALDSFDAWQTPGATSRVCSAVRQELSADRFFSVDDRFHAGEHAVEVELPLMQAAWPHASILPIEVPVTGDAMEVGRKTAKAVIAAGLDPVYLASSDLTHYGPAYRFAPAGIGEAGLQWAMDNDRRLLRVITDMTPERVVPEAQAHLNACGPGAIAAMMAACMEHGATAGAVLRHANSRQMLAAIAPQPPDNAVGYAGVLVR